MNHRHLGQSGLVVSEISYGNWITHGSQVEKDTAIACVRAALEEGITTFDTADIYAKTKAEEVLGEASRGWGGGTSPHSPRGRFLKGRELRSDTTG